MTKNTIAYENKIKVCGETILFRYIAFDAVNHEILLTKLKHYESEALLINGFNHFFVKDNNIL